MAEPRHHLLIAGTGRAGTSALVRYLTALGLDTHVSRRGQAAEWAPDAQAGLEDLPLTAVSPDLPYVVKAPWSYEFIEHTLRDPAIRIDAAILPVRSLRAAAASRSIVQLQALHRTQPWMADMPTTWEHFGSVPGGLVFSMSPTDQARVLAVGFHRLLEHLVVADVPVVLLAFPRFATDGDYLYRRLAPVLPVGVAAERAREAHAATFQPGSVRVEEELEGEISADENPPELMALDNAALRRELKRLRGELAEQHRCAADLQHEVELLRGSRSWRMTRPLRRLVSAARRLRSP